MSTDSNPSSEGQGEPAPRGSRADQPADRSGERAIAARLDLFESRLIAIERRLGLMGAAPALEPGKPADAPTKSGEERLAIVRRVLSHENAEGVPPGVAAGSVAPVRPGVDPKTKWSGSPPVQTPVPNVPAGAEASAPRAARPKPIAPQPSRPSKPERSPVTVEQFIGGKSFLVLGALIVVIGSGFFLKLAVDEGWIGNISRLWRCVFSAAFGAGLLVVGELTVKRLGRFAAAGFRAAGLGVLYATSYAAYGMFGLVSASGAFVMLVAVCVLGIGMALRGRSVSLAVLSLVGGYLAPLIAASESSPEWALAAHLLALLLIGSIIALRVPYQRVLATLTWWGTAVLGTIWITFTVESDPVLVIAFAGVVWSVVHWTRVHLPATSRTHPFWAGMPGAASFSTTVWMVGALVLASDGIGWMRAWHGTGVGFLATLAVAVVLGQGWRRLLVKPEEQRGIIGASLLAQAASSLPLTLLLAIEPRWGELLVFVLLGTAAFWAGRRIEAWAMVAYGTALLALGTIQVLLVPFDEVVVRGKEGSMYLRGVLAGGWFLTPWMWLVALNAGAWMVCGWLGSGWMVDTQRDGFVCRHARTICVSVACVLLPIVFVHNESAGWAIAWGWYGLAIGSFVVSRLIRRPLASIPVLVYLAMATMLTLSLPWMGDRSYSNGGAIGGLVLSWWMIMTGVLGVSWLVCGWRCFRPITQANSDETPNAWVKDLRSLCLVIGCVLLPIVFLHEDASREGVLAGWFGLMLVAFGASRLVRHAWAGAPSAAYLALSTVLWIASFLLPGWMGGRVSVPLLLHPGLIWSVLIAGSWGVYGRVAGRSKIQTIRDSGKVGWWTGGVMLLFSSTLEVARVAGAATSDPTAQAGSVSIWWAVVAAGLLAGGFVRAIAPLRYAGIGLLLLATGKVLTYDLAELSPAVRVGSFIGLGLVLLCVAAWYLRVGTNRPDRAGESDETGREGLDRGSGV
jgi:uncharacterized membrane protein